MSRNGVAFLIIALGFLSGCEQQTEPPKNPYQSPYGQDNRAANPPPGQPVPTVPTTPVQPATPPAQNPSAPATTTPVMPPKVVTPTPPPRQQKDPVRVRMDLIPANNNPVKRVAAARPVQALRDSSVRWLVKPDPLRSDLRYGDSAQGGIDIISGKEGDLRVLYSDANSPFVALGINEGGTTREVWDLRTKKKFGEVAGLALGESPFQVLSSDGKFFAAHPANSTVVGVFDVVAGKPHNVINIDIGKLQYLGFAGTDNLVYVKDDVLHVWEVPTWKEIRQASLPYTTQGSQWNTSAGGSYILFTNNEQNTTYCNLLDTAKGALVGRVKVGIAVQRIGTSFSHDGKFFAVLYTQGPVSNLQIWDMASGSVIAEEKILAPIADEQQTGDCDVDWFPQGQKVLLFGRAVFDLNENKLVRVLPHKSTEPVATAAGDKVVVVQGDRLELLSLDGTTGPAPVSKATLEATLTSGDTYDDSTLPPLSAPDRSEIQEVPLKVDMRAWDYIPRAAKYYSKKVITKPVSIPAGHIYNASISNGEWPYAAVSYSNNPLSPTKVIRPQSEEQPNRVWIEWFEMRNGTKKQPFDLPFATALQDINQEADLIVTRIDNGMDRLDFWSLKDGKHAYGFRPYRNADNPTGAAVDYVRFVNEDKQLITLGGGKLTLWEIPACKAVWEVSVGQLKPIISPALDSIVVSSPDDTRVCFLKMSTGETTGSLATGALRGQPVTAVAFSPDGQSLIIFTKRATGSRVVVQDIAFNKEVHNFALPVPAQQARWLDEDYVLMDGKSLLKISDYAVGWTYNLPAGMELQDSPDGRYWYLSAEDGDYAIVSVVLPDQAAKKTLNSKRVVTEILLSPGESVSIKNHVDSLHANLMQPLVKHLTESLGANGYQVKSAQTTEISIQGIQIPTGNDLQGKLVGELPGILKAPEVNIPEETLTLQVTLSKKGSVVWSKEFQVDNAGQFEFVLDTPPAQIQEIATSSRSEAMWDTILQDSLKIVLPEIIFADGAERGIGESTLSVKGIQ